MLSTDKKACLYCEGEGCGKCEDTGICHCNCHKWALDPVMVNMACGTCNCYE